MGKINKLTSLQNLWTMLYSSGIDINQLWDGNEHEKNIIKRGSVTLFRFPMINHHTIIHYVFYYTYFIIFYHASTLMHAHHIHGYKYLHCLCIYLGLKH